MALASRAHSAPREYPEYVRLMTISLQVKSDMRKPIRSYPSHLLLCPVRGATRAPSASALTNVSGLVDDLVARRPPEQGEEQGHKVHDERVGDRGRSGIGLLHRARPSAICRFGAADADVLVSVSLGQRELHPGSRRGTYTRAWDPGRGRAGTRLSHRLRYPKTIGLLVRDRSGSINNKDVRSAELKCQRRHFIG
jgi:hypothetical protein